MVYNVVGGLAWVLIFLISGYKFGGLESVKHNFHIVIFGILFVSLLPIAFEWIRASREVKRA
jgi:membrane-associated protein